MNIREAIPADYPTILELHRDSIKALCSGHYSEDYISKWMKSRKLEYYNNIPGVEALIVGEENHGKIIGFSRLNIKERFLTGLFIDPGYIGKNYGKQLLNRTEDIARSYGIEELLLYSTLNAMKFYHHMGYVGTTQKTHKIRSGLELLSVEMSKKLT